jgi:NAD(P)-dependent dehydrogenase (short-subunit alcohol dehydrogenase family)
MKQLEGKVSIVTGAGRGIGRAIAQLFAAEGAAVVVASRTVGEGEETVRLIRDSGGEARFIPTDVGRDGEMRRLVDETVRDFGRLDILINNAGVSGPGKPLEATTEEEWDRVIDTNLKGCYLGMRYAIPHLRAAGGGAIVNFSSVLAELTLPDCSGYTAAKAAVIGLTKAAALEVGRDGIRVNCILPGSIDTPMMWEGLSEAERHEFEPRADAAQPLGKVGRPEEIARVALFLVSDGASFMTGSPVLVDGGLLTWIANAR